MHPLRLLTLVQIPSHHPQALSYAQSKHVNAPVQSAGGGGGGGPLWQVRPLPQLPEQQSLPTAHAAPRAAHMGMGTSRRHTPSTQTAPESQADPVQQAIPAAPHGGASMHTPPKQARLAPHRGLLSQQATPRVPQSD